MDEQSPTSIFLSHTASDAPVVRAIQDAIELLFGDAVTVSHSSRRDLDGSIRAGADWFGWITNEVRHAHVTLVVLTPASVQKPWILWETGAVFGAAVAADATDERRVRPLLFGIENADVPDPLQRMGLQGTKGGDGAAVRALLSDLVDGLQAHLGGRLVQITLRVDEAVRLWLARTKEAMRLAPLLPTESVVQEWLSRFNELAKSGRASEVEHLHQWMIVAFGREGDAERPLDVRLHRRLGDLYSASTKHERAAGQYLLAHKLAPRDIYTLRFLGKAYLDLEQTDKAGEVVADIHKLDPDATVHNPECAALKGRWLIAADDAKQARDVYATALDHNRQSYYLADLLGQAYLDANQHDEAKKVYRRALEIIGGLGEESLWMHSTAATAAIVAEDHEAAQRHLEAISRFSPTASDIESVERGLLTLQQRLGLPETRFSQWRAWLRPGELGTP